MCTRSGSIDTRSATSTPRSPRTCCQTRRPQAVFERSTSGSREPSTNRWAYERSCQRYTVARDVLPQPDPLRLRNRNQLTEVVSSIVRDDRFPDDTTVRELATPIVDPADLDDFVAMAINELHKLHEGNSQDIGCGSVSSAGGRRRVSQETRPGLTDCRHIEARDVEGIEHEC